MISIEKAETLKFIKLSVVTIQMGSVERRCPRVRTTDCSLVGPSTTGGPVYRSKLVVNTYIHVYVYIPKPVSGTHTDRFPEIWDQAQTVKSLVTEKSAKKRLQL